MEKKFHSSTLKFEIFDEKRWLGVNEILNEEIKFASQKVQDRI